ncbi:MAG: FtsW/RodA/SpoVE family cell cycle protein, partial [Desulfuromonadaceae bacterium]
MEMRKDFDTTILLLAVVLTCFGIVMVYSSSSIMAEKRYADGFFFLKRQGIYAMAGFLVMAGTMQFNYLYLRKLAVPLLFFCIGLLALVLIPGVGSHAGGAARWIRLGPVSIQPAELAKLGLVIYMAHSLTKKKDRVKSLSKGFIPYMIVLALLLALLLLQP